MTAEAFRIYGLSADDSEVFHVLEAGDLEELRLLIGRDPSCVTARMREHNQTPLGIAARRGNDDMVAELLAAGAPVNDANQSGQTALLFATQMPSDQTVVRLLAAGANPDAVEAGGSTPLHYAAQFGSVTMVEALIRAGAKVEAKTYNESTPVIMAAFTGQTDTIKALAAHGADVAGARIALNFGGPYQNCLSIAAERGHHDLLCYLLDSFPWPAASVNVALKLAAGAGHLSIVQTLAQKGADPLAPAGTNQKSAMALAKQRKQKAVVEYFKSLGSKAKD